MNQPKDADGNLINHCKIPEKVRSKKEGFIYSKLLSVHCSHTDKEQQGHTCCGSVTIRAKSVTMHCLKCGDSRMTL